jgi:hypothetical protein
MRGLLALAPVLVIAGISLPFGTPAQTTAFRISDMDLRDPHVFAQVVTCSDFTDNTPFGSINANMQAAIQTDTDADGYLDLSYVLLFSPLDQAQTTNALHFGAAQCTAPLSGTACRTTAPGVDVTATLVAAGACAEPVAGSQQHAYSPAVTTSLAPCFGADLGTASFNVGGLAMSLHETRVGATFDAVPATQLGSGLIRGFLTEADANATVVPLSTAVFGGKTLSSLLRGGTGNCASGSDLDVLGDTNGWWVYLNFVATRVVLEPIFADGFELGDG